VVPYVILDYSNRGAVSPIKEIILGPRNANAVPRDFPVGAVICRESENADRM